MFNKKTKIFLVILGALIICAIYVKVLGDSANTPGLLKVAILDVGQGDAIFIESPTGNQVLIDGGPVSTFGSQNKNISILSELSDAMPYGDRDIDLVVATHPHADHIQGLVKVFDYYQVGMVIDSNTEYESVSAKNWIATRAKAGQYERAIKGSSIDLGGEVYLDFLYPDNVQHKSKNKAHDNMVVTILRYRDFRMLLTGDLEGYNESNLFLEDGNLPQAQFLKVAHHGSRNSTTEKFLESLSAHVAFISVGDNNRYGHPNPQTISRLDNFGIQQYQTNKNGTIKLSTDGFYYKIDTDK